MHRSKVDGWLVGVVVLAGLAVAGFGLYALIEEGWGIEAATTLGIAVFYWGIIVLVAWPVTYEIAPPELRIRAGLASRTRIPIASIVAARPSRSPLSAPAWSLDRVRIDYTERGKQRFGLVSPQDKRAFLRDLAAADPGLELEGDVLTRRAG